MSAEGCVDIFRLLGYECREVDGEIELTTPLGLPGGTPVCVYIRWEPSGMVTVHDGGEMLLEAAGLGMTGIERFEKAFGQRVAEVGAVLEDGAVVVRVPADQLWRGYATFLRAAAVVIGWIEECDGSRPSVGGRTQRKPGDGS